MDARLMELADGRALAWAEVGDPGGHPVLLFHGTPGSRHQLLLDPAPLLAAGVRLIVPDRPGYGLSTYDKGRTLTDWAEDVRQLADHLGLQRFSVAGISGGGPHALVCGALLADRVEAVAVLSGVASTAEPGSEAGMMPANRFFARVARKAPMVNAPVFGLMAILGRRAPDRVMASISKLAPAPDRAVFERLDVRAAFRSDLAHASKTTGRAAAQDFGLFARDWGFRLEDITVPVQLWQADADVNVPAEHARRQAAAIPGAVLHLFPDEGHMMAVTHLEEILRELLASRR